MAEVTIPWYTAYLVSSPLNVTTGADLSVVSFAFRRQLTPFLDSRGCACRRLTNYTSFGNLAQAVFVACPTVFDGARYPLADQLNPQLSIGYLDGRDIQFCALNDSKTGVIFVPTFSAEGQSEQACEARYYIDAYLGLQSLTKPRSHVY